MLSEEASMSTLDPASRPGTTESRVSRRRLLTIAAIGGSAALLAACGGGGTAAAPTSAPAGAAAGAAATKPAAAGAAAPTTAPAAGAAAAATKPAAGPTTAPAAGAAGAPTAEPTRAVLSAGSGAIEVRWQNRNDDKAIKLFNDAVEKYFIPNNKNVKVTIEPAPAGRDEKIIAQFVAGTAPDVFESWTDNVTLFADKGQVQDVQRYVDRDKMDISDFFAWQWKDFVLPSQIRFGMPKYVNVMTLWVNKDMFQKKGVELPTKDWNHDKYREAMIKLTEKEGDKVKTYGGWIPMDSWDRFWYRVEMFGGTVRDPQDDTKCTLDEQKAQDGLEWARKLTWDDKALIVARTGLPQVAGDRFFNNQYAMAEDGFYPFNMARNNATTKINWMWMHVPAGPAKRRVLGTTDGFVQWKNSKHPEEAWSLMKFLASPELQEVQVQATGLLPIRTSVLDKWKKIVLDTYPELKDSNLDIGPEAMQMGYPGNRQLFKRDAAAREIIVPALQKLYDNPGTPTTYFKEVATQVTKDQKNG